MKQKTIDKLIEITQSIPQHLKDKLMREEFAMPQTREIALRAVKDDTVTGEIKTKLKNLLSAGYLDEKVSVIDTYVAHEIDTYVENEILKAIDNKQLPKSNFRGLLKKARQIKNETRRNSTKIS